MMDLKEATSLLTKWGWIKPNGDLYCLGHYIAYSLGEGTVCLDDDFEIEELEALVVYMKAYGAKS